jgi:hypothetical protein
MLVVAGGRTAWSLGGCENVTVQLISGSTKVVKRPGRPLRLGAGWLAHSTRWRRVADAMCSDIAILPTKSRVGNGCTTLVGLRGEHGKYSLNVARSNTSSA